MEKFDKKDREIIALKIRVRDLENGIKGYIKNNDKYNVTRSMIMSSEQVTIQKVKDFILYDIPISKRLDVSGE